MSVIMGDPKTVLEGSVKYRDKKKWKSRWAVVSKLSPVADCLHIQLYRDSKERCKNGPTKASLSLEEFLGMETGFTLDKESNTMALICSELVVVLAFDNRELLIQWQVKIRANLVEVQQFLVQIAHVPTKSKLPCGPARLHLQDHTFCLVSSVPPRLLGTWPIKELRRFGVIEGKFCFEGGSLCGRGEGLHVLLTNQSADLAQAMDLASKGKLLGKRKTLSRKNSVLETSTRIPLHKRSHHDSSKSTTASDSHRLLLSSGSESSTCDACSEILRSADPCGDDCLLYTSSGSSIKASSCRIHYRWPSCLSRWGQSSTTTTSDVESMDTVSVTLSDFQGPSSTISKSNGHGQSLSCLCDSQGTWPFNQCTKCGRQFYSRNSLQSCRNKQIPSPENGANEATNGFSPQWTMDSLVGSTNDCQSKKDASYQLMNPPSDRASLCSHASHSSSASVASSSGSEYSVPRNYLETLYDRPKSVQHALNNAPNSKVAEPRRTSSVNDKPIFNPHETCILCPCHEPIKDWVNSTLSSSQEKLVGSQECACWSKLSMSVRSEVDIRMINGRKSASANASPNSSPKKGKFNSGASTLRTNNSLLDCDLACTCGKNDPYANYAIPKSAMTHLKDMQQSSTQLNGSKDAKIPVPVLPTEDYDVPKKFTDLLSNCDMNQKASTMKTVANGPSCSCMSACKIVQNIELFKMASKHSYNHKHGSANPSSAETLQMCACQRVMLWAGSLVPCLGPQRQSLEAGWQCTKSLTTDGKSCSRTWYNNTSAVCSEPPKTAEAVVVNGKVKHIIRGVSVDTEANRIFNMSPMSRPRSSTVSYPLSCTQNGVEDNGTNYANIEFSKDSKLVKVTDEPSAVNYANIEFAETLSLYENSNLVLSRLEGDDSKHEPIVTEKPPLPPRSYPTASAKDGSEKDEKCKCIRRSPKKAPVPPKQTTGSAYEMMCYEKNPYENGDEDYLMMQPLCTKNEKTSPLKIAQNDSSQNTDDTVDKQATKETEGEPEPNLPLRPFMPYSYPVSEKNGASAQEGNITEALSRKNQLISEELQLRAMRSNSLSELKKKVLMRKRSSSVDGKNNGYTNSDSAVDVESLPASPICSPRPTVQRKHSLFSKLNLRSKEKSMSTNEIAPPVILPSDGSLLLNSVHKNGLHRSADCLKLNEEYVNSDEELNSDNSDFGVQKDSSGSVMKRSSSVPCRAGVPSTVVTSPVRSHGTIMELNDLNKDCTPEPTEVVDGNNEIVQRKYSLDSHQRPKKRTTYGVKPSCDNVYRQECLDECDTVMELQGVLRRNRVHIQPSDRDAMMENYRSATSSCSSSDISDYLESLSFISRSSSSSSGSTSSTDYVRAEDLYLLRTMPKPPPKSSFIPSNSITVPSVHQSRHSGVEINGVTNHRNHAEESSSAGTSSSSSYHDKPCYPVKDELKVRPCSNQSSNRDSRSSTSSTSSLSTSPSVTDYSSSTSSSPPCQSNLTGRQVYSKCPPDSKPEDTSSVQQNMFVYPYTKEEPRKT